MTTDSTSPGRAADDPAAADDPLPEDHAPGAERAEREAAGKGPAVAPPPRPRGGRLLAAFALLVARAAAGGAGYLYYELILHSDTVTVSAELASLEARLGEVDERLAASAERQQAALASFRAQQDEARTATEGALRESLARVARQAPPSTGEWQRAEAQYLLRIANYRLLMERDVAGALNLLSAADAVLADLDDFALHEVRARLADEIAALESVRGTDVQGMFLRLEAVKGMLDRLPLKVPEYLRTEARPVEEPEGFWATLRQQTSSMLNFRRLDSDVKPLLAPEEAVYLELNLRLMLERAQLAAVRREQLIFDESIATAREWIERYLDTDRAAVSRMLDELASLAQVELARPLPDISGSLNALKEVLRNPA